MLSLQVVVDSLYEKVTGNPIETFKFVPGDTFLSSPNEVAAICSTYLVVIFGGQLLMKTQKPIQLSFLFQIHNAFLTLISLILFLLFVENVAPLLYNYGAFGSICYKEVWTQRLELLYYINYLTKYYELIDTIFLVLQFLHWYHHSCTALLCYTQLLGHTTGSWVVASLNLFVHIFMYFYYLLATFKIKVWWKKYITVLQITQFVIDLFIGYFCIYTYLAYHHYPHLPHFGNCHGDINAGYFGCVILFSYLLLFIQFFFKVYTTKPAQKAVAQLEPSKQASETPELKSKI